MKLKVCWPGWRASEAGIAAFCFFGVGVLGALPPLLVVVMVRFWGAIWTLAPVAGLLITAGEKRLPGCKDSWTHTRTRGCSRC
eukprot:4502706-Alexandrium_andersonii.AAC.1